MATITLAQLKIEARQVADMVGNNFIQDAELTNYINNSISELHDILIQTYESEYYVKSSTFSTTANQDSYALSSVVTDNDFYKLKGVDAKLDGSTWFTIKPFMFNERNKRQSLSGWRYMFINDIRYRIVGGNLVFSPAPDAATDIKLWYTPVATVLSDDADTLEDLNNFSEYIIVDVAIKMKIKAEEDVKELAIKRRQLKRRIEEAASNRDSSTGESVSDVYDENDIFGWRGF